MRNLRILQSWMTNREHTTGFGALTEQILLSPTLSGPTLADALSTKQVVNYNRYQLDGIWDVTSKLALRGGWRREWGDATVRAGDAGSAGTAGVASAAARCGAGGRLGAAAEARCG